MHACVREYKLSLHREKWRSLACQWAFLNGQKKARILEMQHNNRAAGVAFLRRLFRMPKSCRSKKSRSTSSSSSTEAGWVSAACNSAVLTILSMYFTQGSLLLKVPFTLCTKATTWLISLHQHSLHCCKPHMTAKLLYTLTQKNLDDTCQTPAHCCHKTSLWVVGICQC